VKKFTLLAIILLTLSACGEKERVYTAKEFTYDEPLMESIKRKCNENPAKLQDTPNCVNAYAASSMITLRIVERGCYKKNVNTKECLDKFWAEN
jgi:hypothetical protein